MSSLPEMAGYVPAAVSALSAMGAVWRLARRKPPSTTCACLTGPRPDPVAASRGRSCGTKPRTEVY
ncbi:hypothetical protein ABZY81_44250 [Streptomyces sp. NPDC006514]|uniref:hypothetical protein n=1 Tax=Streptomyces sp. NPDC006514 TaxID=3154308 RepID=UPI0033B5D603